MACPYSEYNKAILTAGVEQVGRSPPLRFESFPQRPLRSTPPPPTTPAYTFLVLTLQIVNNSNLEIFNLPALSTIDFRMNVRLHEAALHTPGHLHPRLSWYLPTHAADAVVKSPSPHPLPHCRLPPHLNPHAPFFHLGPLSPGPLPPSLISSPSSISLHVPTGTFA